MTSFGIVTDSFLTFVPEVVIAEDTDEETIENDGERMLGLGREYTQFEGTLLIL